MLVDELLGVRLRSRTSSTCLDSGEPFWTNQTVAKTNSVNWRYSDCQFSVAA